MFPQFLPDALVQAGGWTILHSLWQGAVITLLLAFTLGRTRKHAPAIRYQLSVGALLLLAAAVAATFLYYYVSAAGSMGATTAEAAGAHLFRDVGSPFPAAVAETDYLSRLFPFLLQVWLVGVAFMALRMMAEMFYLQRLRAVGTQLVGAPWQERVAVLSRRLGLRRQVRLKESIRVNSPMLVGWLRPVILVPVGMLSGLSPQQVECVLAHELAHVQRMDYLVNLIQSAVEVLLFFNPAVWWISAQIREEREHCCDELAVRLTSDRLTLIRTLAQLEEWRLRQGQLGLAFNGRPQGVLGRVQRLLGSESTVRIIGKGLWSLLFFSLATGLLAFHEQREGPAPKWSWQNVGLHAPAMSPSTGPDLQAPARSQADVASGAGHLSPASSAKHMAKAVPAVGRMTLPSLPLRALPAWQGWNSSRLPQMQDTIPDEKFEKEMKALHEQMSRLHEEMMNSQEMKQIQELTKKYETEMRVLQEKMMGEHENYEKMMQEQRQVMEEAEQKYRELIDTEAFRALQQEQEKIAKEFSRQAEAFQKQLHDKPHLLEYKLDSLSRIFDQQHEVFEKTHQSAMQALEKEMEKLEDSPQMKALEIKMEAMQVEMEKLMDVQMKPLEVQMEKLQQALEEKFEQQMQLLEEKMELLHRQRSGKREE